MDERKGTNVNLGDERKGKPVRRKSKGGHGWKGQRLGLQSSQMDCRQDGGMDSILRQDPNGLPKGFGPNAQPSILQTE